VCSGAAHWSRPLPTAAAASGGCGSAAAAPQRAAPDATATRLRLAERRRWRVAGDQPAKRSEHEWRQRLAGYRLCVCRRSSQLPAAAWQGATRARTRGTHPPGRRRRRRPLRSRVRVLSMCELGRATRRRCSVLQCACLRRYYSMCPFVCGVRSSLCLVPPPRRLSLRDRAGGLLLRHCGSGAGAI
jgi:hypothetical protein